MKALQVTSLQATRLPRWLLLLLCGVYTVAGLFGRDPWRVDDAVGFGIARTMASGAGIDWLVPNVAGALVPDSGPLPFWIGATAIRAAEALRTLLGPGAADVLTDDFAIRAVAAAGLLGAFAMLWYATYALARRPEIQPDDPFGATAKPHEFARAIADTALLAALATLGLIARIHETTASATGIVWLAMFLYGMARAISVPALGGLYVGAAIAATTLTTGLFPAFALTGTAAVLSLCVHAYRLGAVPFTGTWLPVAVIGSAIWPASLWLTGDGLHGLLVPVTPDVLVADATLRPAAGTVVNGLMTGFADGRAAAGAYLTAWLRAEVFEHAGPTARSSLYFLRNAPWFFWPLWPFVLRGVWRWRVLRFEPLVALPIVLSVFLGAVALSDTRGVEASMLPLVLPLSILTALAVPTMSRGIVGLVDWFAIATFTVASAVVWAYWIALLSGFPPAMSRSARALVPGFEPYFNPSEFAVALGATIAWFTLIRWRTARRRHPFWAPIALSAGGTVLTWLLLMTLLLPPANYRKTYRELASQVGTYLADGGCVLAGDLDSSQRALFAYYAHARFPGLPALSAGTGDDPGRRADPDSAAACPWLLVSDHAERPHDPSVWGSGWQAPVWQGQPSLNRGERLFLYRRLPAPAAP